MPAPRARLSDDPWLAPYADLIYPGLSTGARLAMEIRDAIPQGHLKDIMS